MVKENRYAMVAKTLFGLEEVLANELIALGATDVKAGARVVHFSGDKGLMYKANLCCRTALRILKPISVFPANNENELYDEVSKINWETYMSVDDTLAIDGVVSASVINHSKYAALKTKDAIVDQFRNKYDKRPSVDVANPSLRVNVHIGKDICTISLDSSGDLLNKRGYRSGVNIAPINEVLAAGLILLTGWDKRSPFIDPMCGSGTFLIEAGLMAKNLPPGYLRKQYGFEKWKDFDQKLWKNIQEDVFSKKAHQLNVSISGSDISWESIDIARENLYNAKLAHEIKVETLPFDQQMPPVGSGIVIMNPPYGERMEAEDIDLLYKQIGDRLKTKYAGYTAWILTSNMDAAKHIGLKPTRRISVFNGSLECKFLKFEIYKGTKKIHKFAGNDSPRQED